MVKVTRVAKPVGWGSSAAWTVGVSPGVPGVGAAVAVPPKSSRMPADAAVVVSAVRRHLVFTRDGFVIEGLLGSEYGWIRNVELL